MTKEEALATVIACATDWCIANSSISPNADTYRHRRLKMVLEALDVLRRTTAEAE